MQEKKIVSSTVDSISRIVDAKSEVASKLNTEHVSRHVDGLTKPKSPSSTMKKAGIALIAAPDPITGVAGVALVATSFAMKKNEPTSLENLAHETRKILRDLQSLSL